MTFPMSLVRAGGIFENNTFGLQAVQGGTLPLFYGPTHRKVGHVATADIGALVIELLTREWRGRRVIELGTPVSPDEIAAAIGEALGREVKALALQWMHASEPWNTWASPRARHGRMRR